MLLLELLSVPGGFHHKLVPVELDGDVVGAVLLHVQRQLVLVAVLDLEEDGGLEGLLGGLAGGRSGPAAAPARQTESADLGGCTGYLAGAR